MFFVEVVNVIGRHFVHRQACFLIIGFWFRLPQLSLSVQTVQTLDSIVLFLSRLAIFLVFCFRHHTQQFAN